MSYNGIGLSTARGSGTNGFIQKNNSFAVGKNHNELSSYAKRQKNKQDNLKRDQFINIKDKEIVNHEQKRKEIDLKVSEYRDKLEDDEELDLNDDEIDIKCKEFKDKLIKEINVKKGYKSRSIREKEDKKPKAKEVDY
ncbi:Pre-mRNA-splicing factor [Wickerhamomyces ciferrii]|uniref:Pre-mRNA-splicing factor CWC21 n=1 Tax=Wickerhamomyces ciferrii (strain ATCC 14091 / BCRC 22168 / CBS 111 / JCM 3599 / NBRC 0793 / NRRL Y-1031 F-60-10) TaxID=1206466 RepID=K0KN19_WICCF|nr:Pre-mRNA-splicing factor [Wickerhamomyces ciferrii]CCH46660.1 Pre-mRNA-splicing factor [Wickerhamomyces ciferrii]